MKILFYSVLVGAMGLSSVHAQSFGVKTNGLYWATTTMNAGVELKLGNRSTASLVGAYNPWQFPSKRNDAGKIVNSKLKHFSVMPEYKYWFCKAFEQAYVGLHGIYSEYNAEGVPFVKSTDDYRYDGFAYGGGVSVGYQYALGNRGGLELSLGAGYIHTEYDKYYCGACGDKVGSFGRDYFGITKAAMSFIYFLK